MAGGELPQARYTEGRMFGKLRNMVVWQYPEATSVETLLRHRRWATGLMYTWTGSVVLMFSTMAQFLLSSEGLAGTITMIILIASGAVGLLLSVPAFLSLLWASDIDKALAVRGCPQSQQGSAEHRLGIAAIKMFFWAIVVMVIANLLL